MEGSIMSRDLVFEPAAGQEKSWTVRDGATGEPVGTFGFGQEPGAGVFADPAALAQVSAFIGELEARA